MKTALVALLLLLSVNQAVTASNPEWVKLDQELIRVVNALVNQKPAVVQQYFAKGLEGTHHLGFGWKSKDFAASGGYMTIKARCYYYHDTLVSYTIEPWLPTENAVKDLYVNQFSAVFKPTPGQVRPYHYNPASLQKALGSYRPSYPLAAMPVTIADYMSPESGLEYGYSGGEAPVVLRNRCAFIQLQDQLSTADIVLLMHAVNPASRLTAIEYYLKNKKRFTQAEQRSLNQWVEVVFNELPEVESLQGCIGGLYNARELVARFSKTKR